jgi:adenine phosphoribosyltransferase
LLKEKVNKIHDFPQKGILFYDIFSILKEVQLTQKLFDVSEAMIKNFLAESGKKVTAIVGLESRGFLIGLVLADRLKLPFIPIRKRNKLPGNIFKVNYVTEYSQDQMELQADSLDANSKVLIVDDLLATGGSMRAAEDLIKMTNSQVVGYFVVFEIECINGKQKLGNPDNLITMIKI